MDPPSYDYAIEGRGEGESDWRPMSSNTDHSAQAS